MHGLFNTIVHHNTITIIKPNDLKKTLLSHTHSPCFSHRQTETVNCVSLELIKRCNNKGFVNM